MSTLINWGVAKRYGIALWRRHAGVRIPPPQPMNMADDTSKIPGLGTSGPVKTSEGYSIEVDRNLCVTLAVCLGIAPDVFELDAEGKAVIKNLQGADLTTLLEAAKGCPVNAIIMKNKDGKRLWPDPEAQLPD